MTLGLTFYVSALVRIITSQTLLQNTVKFVMTSASNAKRCPANAPHAMLHTIFTRIRVTIHVQTQPMPMKLRQSNVRIVIIYAQFAP